MRKLYFVIATALLVSFCHAQGTTASNSIARFEVLLTGTNFLTIDVELFDHDKPETVRNFLAYVRGGAYSNLVLHRAEPGFVIQGGGVRQANPLSSALLNSYIEVPELGDITNEFSVGPRVSNDYGTIAMARRGEATNSASAEWFFNLTNNAFLDDRIGGYTVFGRVINTVNERTGTNALNYFNSLSYGNGLKDMGLLFSGFNLHDFSHLPVTYQGDREARLNDLFYLRISILNDDPRDRTRPKVTITNPALRFVSTTNETIEVSGTASDDRELLRVLCTANPAGGVLEVAAGKANWRYSALLGPGTNTVDVVGLDTWGNPSPISTLTVFRQVRTAFRLGIVGSGSVVGLTNGQVLDAGRIYSMTAKAAPGYYFARWRTGIGTNLGPEQTTNPKIAFRMSEGYSLTAEFIPNIAPVSISTNGHGTIRGVVNGQTLTLGRTYVINAKPDPGHFFVGWRGAIGTNAPVLLSIYPRLAFHMLPDLSLIADFYPNLFLNLKGTYNGVFTTANNAAPRNSGWLTLNLAASRNYTGRLEPLGKRFIIRGSFDVYGRSTISGSIGTNILTLTLQLQTNGTEKIIGAYFDGASSADLVMYRAPKFTNAPPQAGQYTFVIPGMSTNSSGSMEGDGVGTMTLDSTGTIVMTGTLADGTEINQTTTLLADGHWALLGEAYDDGGLLGMMTFFTNGVAGFDGDVKWINPGLPVPLKESTRVIGSGYVAPSAQRSLFDWSAGLVELSGGNLPIPTADDVTVQGDGRFQVASGTENLQLTLTPGTGIITGTFVNPATSSVTPIKAAVLQNSNSATGFFISGGQSGGIRIRAK